jgi:LTXXQ motif family protein
MLACSERSFARTRQPADVKSQAQADAAASPSKHVTEVVDARSPRDNGTVILDLSFSSLEIDPSFAEYLSLTASQITAIQRLMSQERREVEPLKAQLQSIHRKLLAASDRGQPRETEVFAVTEGRILTKLIIKNSRTQARLHGLLTHEQRKKLGDLEALLNQR